MNGPSWRRNNCRTIPWFSGVHTSHVLPTMAFVLPTFPSECGIWRAPIDFASPPDLVSPCQLRGPGSTYSPVTLGTTGFYGVALLLLPPLTDIRDRFCIPGNSSDGVEVPLGSGRYYVVALVDDTAKGFPNEHRFAGIAKSLSYLWPETIP
jgi:hypothetical protein